MGVGDAASVRLQQGQYDLSNYTKKTVKFEDGSKQEVYQTGGRTFILRNGELCEIEKTQNGNLFHSARYSTAKLDAEDKAAREQQAARSGDATALLEAAENQAGTISTTNLINGNVLVKLATPINGISEFVYNSKTNLLVQDTFIDENGNEVFREYEETKDGDDVAGSKLATGIYTVKDSASANSSTNHNLVYDIFGNVESDHVTGTENNIKVDYTTDFRGRVSNDKKVGDVFQDTRVPAELKAVLGEDFDYSQVSEINYQYYNTGNDNGKVALAEVKLTDGTSRKIKFGMTENGYGIQTDQKLDDKGQEIKEPTQYDPGEKSWYDIVTQDYGITGKDAIYEAIGQLKKANDVNNRRENIGPQATMIERSFATPEITINGEKYTINQFPTNKTPVTPEQPAAPDVPEKIDVPANVAGDAIPKKAPALGEIPDLASIDKYDPNNGSTITINGRNFKVERVSSDNLGKTVFLENGNQINIAYNDDGSIKGINLFNNSNWPNHVVMRYSADGKPLGSMQNLYDGADNSERKMCTGVVIRNAQGEVTGFSNRSGTEDEWTVDCFKPDGTFAGRILHKKNGDDFTKVFYGADGKKAETIPEEFELL